MKSTIILLVLLTIVFFIKGILKRQPKFSLLAYCLTIGLSGLNLFRILTISTSKMALGQFGAYVNINILSIISLLLILDGNRIRNQANFIKPIVLFLCFFFCMSFINPNNTIKEASLPPAIYFVQLIFFVYLVKSLYSKKEILESLYEAVTCWIIIEFILTLCYPILGIKSVATLFYGETAEAWSMRRENYLSSVGTFAHPANLGYVCSLYSLFLFSLYFFNYKKRESFIYFILSTFIVFFTFSRASYLALVGSLSVVFFLSKSKKNVIRNGLLYSLLVFAIIYSLLHVPIISDLFLKSDADKQMDNRWAHYIVAWDIFSKYPLMGTGINNHVNYIFNHVNWIQYDMLNRLYEARPIHNSHLIILVETGLIGFTIFVSCIIYLIKILLSSIINNKKDSLSSIVILGAIVFALIYGCFGWSVYYLTVLTPLSLIICLMWGFKTDRVKYERLIISRLKQNYHNYFHENISIN